MHPTSIAQVKTHPSLQKFNTLNLEFTPKELSEYTSHLNYSNRSDIPEM
jgi:hypothetical protein